MILIYLGNNGYNIGALPRGRCARSMAGFAGLVAEANSSYSLWAGVCGQPRVPLTAGTYSPDDVLHAGLKPPRHFSDNQLKRTMFS